ncbi:unnamed protein product [Arabis nemorensis]|uniref:Uncharacterized protein n=1 Tax=Arabis nemorensis TaxID=586526 RepID=A0A565AKJ3_9BRAS|nr:unnamed protein product [Arabis nemorensis]
MSKPTTRWNDEELNAFLKGIEKHGLGKWTTILKDEEFREALSARTEMSLREKHRSLVKASEKGKGKVEDVIPQEDLFTPQVLQTMLLDIEAGLKVLMTSTTECPISVSTLEDTKKYLQWKLADANVESNVTNVESGESDSWWDNEKLDMLLELSLLDLPAIDIWEKMVDTYKDITLDMVAKKLKEAMDEFVDVLLKCVSQNVGFSHGKPIAAVTQGYRSWKLVFSRGKN